MAQFAERRQLRMEFGHVAECVVIQRQAPARLVAVMAGNARGFQDGLNAAAEVRRLCGT
jgi:hypothetical protein